MQRTLLTGVMGLCWAEVLHFDKTTHVEMKRQMDNKLILDALHTEKVTSLQVFLCWGDLQHKLQEHC